MLNLNSIMIGTAKPKELAEFYQKVFNKPADMADGDWNGWQVGNGFLTIGFHSEVEPMAKDPKRIIFNFETKDVKEEYDRIKSLGATEVKALYQMGEGENAAWIATLADPDGNYFQLMTPWEA